MPVVPAQGESTVCEINRDLLTKKDESDKSAQEAYVKIVGRVFSSIPFKVSQPENGLGNGNSASYYDEDQAREGSAYYDSPTPRSTERRDDAIGEDDAQQGIVAKRLTAAKTYVSSLLQAVVGPFREAQGSLTSQNFQAVSWHKQKHWLAFISNADQVLVCDFDDSDSREPTALASDSQRGVEAIEWRPNSGATVSVACRGGICIWSASFPGNIPPVRGGVVSVLGTPNRGTGARWALVDFLKNDDNNPVTTISWSPSGRLLASASKCGPTITIWEVAQGLGSPVRRGFGGIALLKWSPTGDYLFSARLNGAFNLWETNRWTSEPWSSSGGRVVSAMWGPDGHVLLTAFDESTTLGTLYFPSHPPSLDVHLLPLDLHELATITGGRGGIDKMAWDGTGERLAVSFTGGDATYSGLIAIYDSRHNPIVSLTFLGFIRGPELNVKPVAFAFHNKLKQGALLAVCWSCGICCAYPLLFRTH